MKRIWVRVDPWDKQLAIAALDSGADAVVVAEGHTPKVKELGALATVASDGDIRPGEDVVWMEIRDKADEEAAATSHLDKTVVLRTTDWTVIPLENLVSRRSGLMLEVAGAEQARVAVQVLERGVDGVVLDTRDPEELHRTVTEVHGISPRLEMTTAEITAIKVLGMGDRACVDTCTTMGRGEGMLVGNSGQAFFLVHSESLETEFLNPRPFRVNAGAVHAYIMLAEGKTVYLSELKAGDEVLLVRHDGQTSVGYVGRNKIERRPLLLVEAEAAGRALSLVMQNGETIYLTNPEGEAVSVASLKPGDKVLVHVEPGGRHLGVPVEETISEK
ncbi:MAG: 3-dehydroquinate synthase II [Armatimonadota bacterium]|nr:MAG: 3-dehydroquinate synthase II [Armatimonadota bacterium]